MKRVFILSVCIIALSSLSPTCSQTLAPFKAGDRVAFVGNSITDGGHYHSYLWLYYMTRMPDTPVWMMNCGIGGDTSAEILGRLQGDVIDRNPTVIMLTYGMNDAGLFELYGDSAESFSDKRVLLAKQNVEKMADKLRLLSDTRIVLVGTSPYDATTKFNNNIFPYKAQNIRRMIQDERDIAERNGWKFFDFESPMTALNTLRQQNDTAFTVCGPDRIHPDNDGHMYMAYLILKAQGFVGRKVADVNIDARKKRVVCTEHCDVSQLVANGNSVSFDYLAESLPYPLDTIARGGMEFTRPQSRIVNLVPEFMKEMNAEMLTVAHLEKGNYMLQIDENTIDTLTSEQLGAGVNLALYNNTPQMRQAREIMMLNEDRWDMERRLRDWAWVEFDFFLKNGFDDVNSTEAERFYEKEKQTNWWVASRRDIYAKTGKKAVRDACQKYMQSIVDSIYRINKPVNHRIVLTKIN